MDMKRILQAMDGVATKPVEGADSMSKFLRVVKEADLNKSTSEAVEYLPIDPEISAQLKAQSRANLDAEGPKNQAETFVRFSSGMYNASALPKTMNIRPGVTLPVKFNPIKNMNGDVLANAIAANKLLPPDLQFSPDELSQVVGQNAVQETAPVAPTAPAQPQATAATAQPQATAAPAQPQVDPAHYQVPSVEFLKKNYKQPYLVIHGAHPSETDPQKISAWEQGSDFDDLMMALNGSYYQARKADPNYQQPAFVKDDWELVQRMLGTPEGKEYAIDQAIGLSDINDTSPEAEFNRAQHKEFEKQANARLMQQPDGVINPGWKYDQKLGMTPAQAALQAQKAQQPATVQESMDKFLSIVKKNDVSILNEGTNPHKVALPVQMAMQHYQRSDSSESKNSSLIKKYFHEVENEINEQAIEKRQLMNQYASTIAKRVLVKESKNQDVEEMAAHLRNDPDGHTIIPHGGMGSGKEETWKNISTKKLQQVIDMINSGNYSGAEHTLYKAGFLQGAVTALARYQEFKDKQGKRRMKAGKEVELGESTTETPVVDPQLKSQFESLLSKF